MQAIFPENEKSAQLSNLTEAFLAADEYCHQVQGFSYGGDYVIRDIWRDIEDQEIVRVPCPKDGSGNPDVDAVLGMCEAVRSDLKAAAALAVSSSPGKMSATQLREAALRALRGRSDELRRHAIANGAK